MPGTIGHVPYFTIFSNNWKLYVERLEQFISLNKIPEEKKANVLFSGIDDPLYSLLRDTCHPQLPKEKTYEELIEILSQYFVRGKAVYRARYEFYNAKQYEFESISDWFDRLRNQTRNCNFGENINDILLDRFISGLRPSLILDQFGEVNEDSLTLESAVQIAVDMECSLKDTAAINKEDNIGNGIQQRKRHRNRHKRRQNQESSKDIQPIEAKEKDRDSSI